MTKTDDFLIEIQTEELPPTLLYRLAESFSANLSDQIKKENLTFSDVSFFATPRRLAVLVKDLIGSQSDQIVERKGPALKAAFDKDGQPTKALMGFAKSAGAAVSDLHTIKNDQGEWMGVKQNIKGQAVTSLLPAMVNQAVSKLSAAKKMRWSSELTIFVRPVHSVVMLYGKSVIPANILGCKTGRTTQGHRFLSPGFINIPHASQYASLLETEGKVIPLFEKRVEIIQKNSRKLVLDQCGEKAQVLMSDALLNEVAGLIEWPVALIGRFDPSFLILPQEVLISAMEDHQRYFPVLDEKERLLPFFVVIANIETHQSNRVVHGNERVLRARLSDALFFYNEDQKTKLADRVPLLKGMIFQAKLGTLFDKAERLQALSQTIIQKLDLSHLDAARAGRLAKADLTTQMVNEFPELQGVMGHYYAFLNKEPPDVAQAIFEHVLPRFSKDYLPQSFLGQAVAIADRLDNLVGIFGINQRPTGEKDPFGLRRAAIGLLRIMIENNLDLDLKELIEAAIKNYNNLLPNQNVLEELFNFFQERLRVFYQERQVDMDVFASVQSLSITNPHDLDHRIKAVQAFKRSPEAESLAIANKRVSNILSQYQNKLSLSQIDTSLFDDDAEKILADQLEEKVLLVKNLYEAHEYEALLQELSSLRQPIDQFFDRVMVMTDDLSKRENRLLLLKKLRALFLQVADIALLNS